MEETTKVVDELLVEVLNELLVELFNDVLTIEKNAINESEYKDLSVTEIHVLEAIGLVGSRNMTDIASDLGITVGTLTTSINRLVKKEYVSRSRSLEDRRFVQIELSNKGKAAYAIHEAFHKNMVLTMIEKLSGSEQEVLIQSLKQLCYFFRENYRVGHKKGN